MERLKGKTAIVTGASSGIGYATAKKLAEIGMNVVAVARRAEKLKELSSLSKGKIIPFPADITKENEVIEMIKCAENKFGSCHVLINNAGVALCTKILKCDVNAWRKTFDLNVIAVGVGTREFMLSLNRNGIEDGHIINISSIAAHGVPEHVGKHLYNASKHALRLITEGMRAELTAAKSKTKVSMISPGLVESEILEAGGWKREYFTSFTFLKSTDVADAIVSVLTANPNVQITECLLRPVGEIIIS